MRDGKPERSILVQVWLLYNRNSQSLRGTRALFKRTMKYRRLSTMWVFHFKSLDIGKIIYLKILCTRHVKTFITSFTSLCLFIVNSFTLQDTYFLDKLLNRGLSTLNSLISNNSMQTSLTGVFLPLFYSFAISELSEFMFSFYSFSLTDVQSI